VAMAAAGALGRLGRAEGRPILLRLLRDQPSSEVIEGVVPIAAEDCVVLLGRAARQSPDLAGAVLDALTPSTRPALASSPTRSAADPRPESSCRSRPSPAPREREGPDPRGSGG
jgi:hypothetical protein